MASHILKRNRGSMRDGCRCVNGAGVDTFVSCDTMITHLVFSLMKSSGCDFSNLKHKTSKTRGVQRLQTGQRTMCTLTHKQTQVAWFRGLVQTHRRVTFVVKQLLHAVVAYMTYIRKRSSVSQFSGPGFGPLTSSFKVSLFDHQTTASSHKICVQ